MFEYYYDSSAKQLVFIVRTLSGVQPHYQICILKEGQVYIKFQDEVSFFGELIGL